MGDNKPFKTNRDYVRDRNSKGTVKQIEELTQEIHNLGYSIEIGNIGKKTTYCLLYKEDTEEEIVGYTFVKDIKYLNENVGILKAMQQAMARREVLLEKDN